MPLKKLYSTYHITNSGELKTSQMLELELSYHPGYWQLIHSFLRGKSRKDSAGECDFILIGEKGILVLEVKGSQWKLQDHRFSQKKGEEWINKESPFVQVRENKSALIDILHKNGIRDVLVANAVVFPECTFPLQDPPDPFWHLGKAEEVSLSLFLEEVLEEQFALQTETNGLRLNVLSRDRMEQISKLLCPQVMPNEVLAHLLLSQDEAKRRASDNLRILDGLNENKRILIQGPPGSGKSSYALAMAARKSAEGYKKILYLCWNELLAAYNSYKLQELGITGAEAWPFYPYVLSLMEEAGLNPHGTSS
ncbi:MAG: NERD domain-containing protein [Bacteroidetes bacterium]|nr:NERD domain-containing protein [Bacteroidota bacterium]